MDGVRQKSKHEACPLKLWNKVVRRTTRMTIGDELRPAYIEMCTIINEVELKGHLEGYPDLFLLKNNQQHNLIIPSWMKQNSPMLNFSDSKLIKAL